MRARAARSAWRSLWASVAFRLTLNYGLLAVTTTLVLLVFFYFQTVGVLHDQSSRQVAVSAQRLLVHYEQWGRASLVREIEQLLADRIDVDTEMYLLLDEHGHRLAGNLQGLERSAFDAGQPVHAQVLRHGAPTYGNLRVTPLSDGATLVVGRDMSDMREMEALVGRASLAAALVAVCLVLGGTYIFRRELEHRVADIRRTAARVSAGELQQRVPASASEHADEFAHLNRDINNMLDRIQALMDGVRNVSDSIAHNVRTPLARVLTRLRMAQAGEAAALAQANQYAVAQIEELIVMVEKLLQIAEAESGMRRQGFSAVRLDCICADVAELYGPMAEEGGCRLEMAVGEPVRMHGDADLLAGMIANLVENAIKYAGRPARVRIEAEQQGETVSLTVRDDGQGIPRPHLARLGTRFHRVDRSTPGYGLGLASVRATAGLHGGSVRFRDAAPGLAVDIVFPAPTA